MINEDLTMAGLNLFGKAGKNTVKATTQYSALSQDISDNEEEDDEVFVQGTKLNGTSHENEVIEMEPLHLEKGKIHNNQPDVKIKRADPHARTRKCISVAAILAVIIIALVFAFLLPCVGDDCSKTHSKQGSFKPHFQGKEKNWQQFIDDYATESCVRLVDVDEDGSSDIIFGLALGKHVERIHDKDKMKDYCESLGYTFPCFGRLTALRGHDGKELWHIDMLSEVFEIYCDKIDVNKDGKMDCIGSGRQAEILAFDPRKGKILWEGNDQVFNKGWNIYGIVQLPDFDSDGVPEILIPHGGEPKFHPDEHNRFPGKLILMSGATGKVMGRPMEMPDKKETYSSVVLYTRKDGSQYVLFGTGGETISGKFLAISIPDLYHYIFNCSKDTPVPGIKGSYSRWGDPGEVPVDDMGVHTLYNSPTKGVMVPSVLVDVTNDGLNDIVMNAFDGTTIVFDGETLKVVWKSEFPGFESYSSPAPGYFNDDDTLDFMTHWSLGSWPLYKFSQTLIQDGKTGDVLWSFTSNKYEMASPLVLRTTEKNRDVFLFRVQGREGNQKFGGEIGVLHGIIPQRKIGQKKGSEVKRSHETNRRKRSHLPHRMPPTNPEEPEPSMKDIYNYLQKDKKYKDLLNKYIEPEDPGKKNNDYDYASDLQQRYNKMGVDDYGEDDIQYGKDTDLPGYTDTESDGSDYHEGKQQNKYSQQSTTPLTVRRTPAPTIRPKTTTPPEGNPDYIKDTGELFDESRRPVSGDGGIADGSKMPLENDREGSEQFNESPHGKDDAPPKPPSCEDDNDISTTEIFAIDRTTMTQPIQLLKVKSIPFHYNFTEAIAQVYMKELQANPESSGKGTKLTSTDQPLCVYMDNDEKTTGVIGDINGNLSTVVLMPKSAVLKDAAESYFSMKYQMDIFKINIQEALKSGNQILINATVSKSMTKIVDKKSLQELTFLPADQQPWTGYLGREADNIYHV